MTTPSLTLVSHYLCPFVQRATITLLEKQVPFERRFVDLSAKPDWLLAISPLGKVPLLIVKQDDGSEAVLFESAVICEYLEETQKGPALHPADPLTRAQHRAWVEFGSTIFMDLWGFQTAPDAESYETRRQGLIAKFTRLESELGDGPYFAGEAFSLVDVAFAPAFRYFDAFEPIVPIDLFDDLPRVSAWRKALAERPSVRGAVGEDYAEKLIALVREHDGWFFRDANRSGAA